MRATFVNISATSYEIQKQLNLPKHTDTQNLHATNARSWENECSMKADQKNQARHLFFQGKTLKQAAEAVGVSKSTTERWSVEGNWAEQRVLLEQELKDKFIRENFKVYYANVLGIADASFRLLTDAFAERQLVFQGKLPARRLKYSLRTMLAAGKTYTELQGVLSNLESYKRTLKLG